MELKRYKLVSGTLLDRVLIVPYGIETVDASHNLALFFKVLIVPYGIETTLQGLGGALI